MKKETSTKASNHLYVKFQNYGAIITKDKLEPLFSQYGLIERIDVVRNFCFVVFKTVVSATQAKNKLNGFLLDGCKLLIDYASAKKPSKPSKKTNPTNKSKLSERKTKLSINRRSKSRSPVRRCPPIRSYNWDSTPSPKYSRSRSRSRSPIRRYSRSPIRSKSRSPVRRSPPRRSYNWDSTPSPNYSRSVRSLTPPSPNYSTSRRYSRSPIRRYSRSSRRYSRSPIRSKSRSPIRRYSRSPAGRSSYHWDSTPSPKYSWSRSRSRSPIRRYSKSPTRRYSKSCSVSRSPSPKPHFRKGMEYEEIDNLNDFNLIPTAEKEPINKINKKGKKAIQIKNVPKCENQDFIMFLCSTLELKESELVLESLTDDVKLLYVPKNQQKNAVNQIEGTLYFGCILEATCN